MLHSMNLKLKEQPIHLLVTCKRTLIIFKVILLYEINLLFQNTFAMCLLLPLM